MELSKNDTKMIQGLSVMAMLCLHLFDKDYQGLFTPLLFLFGRPLSFYFGQLSDFCVMGFAFCTGYAHFTLSNDKGFYKKRLKSLLVLLCNYWLIMVVFSIISLIIGHGDRMPGDPITFILNASMIQNSYNGAWWYMYAYTVLVLISPIMMKIIKRAHPILIIVGGTVIYVACHYIRFHWSTDDLLLSKIGPFGVTWFEYMLGAVCCKICYFSKIGKIKQRINSIVLIVLAVIGFVGLLLGHTLLIQSVIIAPVTGLIIITIFHLWNKSEYIKRFFTFIGKHSTNIWLTHMFFYSVMFVDLVYLAKYPILIYCFMLVISLMVSIVISYLSILINYYIKRIMR